MLLIEKLSPHCKDLWLQLAQPISELGFCVVGSSESKGAWLHLTEWGLAGAQLKCQGDVRSNQPEQGNTPNTVCPIHSTMQKEYSYSLPKQCRLSPWYRMHLLRNESLLGLHEALLV